MEIEAKLPLDATRAEALRRRLGTPEAVHRQVDVYLATAGVPVALRVRQDDTQAWVTLKSGFEKVAGIRVREEIEPPIRVEDVPAWLTIFERLGFPAGSRVAKRREEYAFMGVHVLIDEIEDLGTFCEVESVADDAPAALERLEAAIAALGLGDLPRIEQSYRELLAERRGSPNA